MAGAGFKDFVAGDVLTAAQVDTYLMQQTIMCFASDAARDSALSGSLSEGLHAYTTDNNRLYYYNGSAWVVVSEPRQAWSPSVTQTGAVSGTVNRGWYQRSNGVWHAYAKWTASAAGTSNSAIEISTPLTLADAADIGGSFWINDGGATTLAGVVIPSTTAAFRLLIGGSGTGDPIGVTAGGGPTLASGDVIYVALQGSY